MWGWGKRRRISRRRSSSVTKHYLAHKEAARSVVLNRLEHFNQHYGFTWNRVAIRNQRRCWGSCTSLNNLNFSYKLLFLPECLADYVILHELCHLRELNHGPQFWALMAAVMPDYNERRRELRRIELKGHTPARLEQEKAAHTCAYCCK